MGRRSFILVPLVDGNRVGVRLNSNQGTAGETLGAASLSESVIRESSNGGSSCVGCAPCGVTAERFGDQLCIDLPNLFLSSLERTGVVDHIIGCFDLFLVW